MPFRTTGSVFTALQVLSYRDEDFFRGLRDLVEVFQKTWRVNINVNISVFFNDDQWSSMIINVYRDMI